MEMKGYVSADGRVTRVERDDTIGEVLYKEERFNLRRVLVDRTWIVRLNTGTKYQGRTRTEAVDSMMRGERVAR